MATMMAFPGTDRIYLRPGVQSTDAWLNGLRVAFTGEVAAVDDVPAYYSNGFGFNAAGLLCYLDCTAGLPGNVSYSNGLPFSAGRLCISTGAVAVYSMGIPLAANGAVAVTIGGGPVVQTLRYIGPTDRRAPVDAVYVPYSDRANLQARIDANQKIYLDGGNYSTGGPASVTVGSGKEIYGVANSTRINTINIAAGSTAPLIRDVMGEVVFVAGSAISDATLVGVNNGGIRSIGATVDRAYVMSSTGSQMLFDNSAGGRTRNCIFLRHQTHNGGNPGLGGYWANKRCFELNGNADLSSYGNVYLVGNALTSSTTQVRAVNQDSVVIGVIDLENYDPPLANEGSVSVVGCGDTRFSVLMGSTVGQQTYNVDSDRAFLAALHANGSLSPRSLISATTDALALWGRTTDDGTITDNGSANSPRFGQVADNGGLQYNGGLTAPTAGAQMTAARAFLVDEARTYIRIPKPTERVVKNPNPNWSTLRGSAPDDAATLQALINAAGNGGTVQLNDQAYYISTPLLHLPNQNWVGGPNGTTSITCKAGVTAAIRTNWSPPDPSGGLNPVSYSLNMSDITFYGDTSGVLFDQPNCQMTLSTWARVAFRNFDQAIYLNASYAVDNNTMIYVDSVDCDMFVRQLGTGSVGPETPYCMYMDKTYFFRCQIENAVQVLDWQPKRPNNLDGFVDCYFKNCAGLYSAQFSNFTTFINCVATGVSAAPACNAASNWIACSISMSASGKFTQMSGMYLEGCEFSGASGATIFSPTAPGDPRDLVVTLAENCDFSALPTGITFGPVGVRWESLNAVNCTFNAADSGNVAGAVGFNRYFTNGTPTTADDVRANQSNFVSGVGTPGTRLYRIRT